MDAKYFAEIEGREQKATPGPWKVGDGSKQSYRLGKNAVVSHVFGNIASKPIYHFPNSEKYNEHVYADMDFIAHSRTERLNGKLETLKCLEASEHQQIAALKKEYNEQDDAHHKLFMAFCKQKKQIATLKKALKLACTDLADRDYPPSNAEQGAQENVTFYIQLAQEPSCHTCQKVSGCQHRCFEPNDYEPCAEYQAQEQEEKG